MKLVIRKKEYEIPTNLSLEVWCDLMRYGFSEENYNRIISIAFNIPEVRVKLIPKKQQEVCLTIIQTLMNPPIRERHNLKINLNNITFGDFIDMEVYIDNGIHKNMKQIIDLLFDLEYSDELKITDVYEGLIKYFNFRKSIFNRYKKLFDADDEIPTEKEKLPTSYIWWEILMILADGKFLNIDEATKKPLIQALNYISWNKDKNTREINRQKKMRNEL